MGRPTGPGRAPLAPDQVTARRSPDGRSLLATDLVIAMVVAGLCVVGLWVRHGGLAALTGTWAASWTATTDLTGLLASYAGLVGLVLRRSADRSGADRRARPPVHLAPVRRGGHRGARRAPCRRRRGGGLVRARRGLGRDPRPHRPPALHGWRHRRCPAHRRGDGDLLAVDPPAAGLRDLVLRAPPGLRRPGPGLRPPAVPGWRPGERPPGPLVLGRAPPRGDRRARCGGGGGRRCGPLLAPGACAPSSPMAPARPRST